MVQQVFAASRPARRRWALPLGIMVALALAASAFAAPSMTFDGAPGTKAPPGRLGGLRMFKFGRDHRHRGAVVTTVDGPTGEIAFSHAVHHVIVKHVHSTDPKKLAGYWQTWSHGYRGDAYYVDPSTTITLPPGTRAFYFYAEPEDPQSYAVTASTAGVNSGPVKVRGHGGAKFFGFVATGGAELSAIEVSSNDRYTSKKYPGGFAIGEFAIHGAH